MPPEQQMRHLLAMHCTEQQASDIFNKLYDVWITEKLRDKYSLTEQPSMAICRFIWADSMINAGKVPTQRYLTALGVG